MDRYFAGLCLLIVLLASGGERLEARDATQQVLIEARIVAVSSGDAMQVLHDFDLKDLSLSGVECPSGDQPFAAEARSFTQNRLGDREMPIIVFHTDAHGRLIGDIRLEGDKTLARELIAEGLGAWNHLENPDPQLGALETQARLEQRGMWQLPQLSRIPVLGSAMPGQGSGDIEPLAQAILALSPGDRARLSARLGGGLSGPATVISGSGYPGQATDGARIIQRSSGRSTDLGIGFGDDGIRLRGGASEHQHTSDTQIEVLGGGSGGTLIIENGVVPGGGHSGSVHGGGGIVYLDGSGVFHRASCFGDGPRGKAFSREDAIARGYPACAKCRP